MIARSETLARSLVAMLAIVCAASVGLAADARVDYETHIKPMLRERCFSCHGALKQKSGLRLDTVELMLRGGETGPVITRGDVSKSLLIERITATDIAQRMPPEHEGEPFSPEQVQLLREWIADGATSPVDEQPDPDPKEHWAFRSVERPAVPQVANAAWVKNPIDAFLSRQYEQHKLTPQSEAPREVLLRRLHLDLIGIPPTAEEIAAFEADTSPEWYEKTVERLLNDPRHGERWGRHWMDIWRYSDWWGLGDQLRNSQKHIWHWRDWIIESLNDDVPYDEMVRLMLAADELYPHDLDKLRATGYLARNYFLFNRNQWMEETVEHVGKGFLGLTLNCAKCHDHKYDPFAHADFYKMRAFFEPYHVRLDVAPGEADLNRDGIPRVYDGHLDLPTYRFVRGQENSPDKSTVIAPGVPEIFTFRELMVQPVTLPAEAWQPERRPWVLDAYLTEANRNVDKSESAVVAAREKLAAAQKRAADALANTKPETKQDIADAPAIHEKFETLDEKLWKLFGGEWFHQPGKLEQKQDGPTRATLRWLAVPPRDFDAAMRFTVLGGSQYRSIVLSFDAPESDPTQQPTADDSEQIVYVSAQQPGSKVQAAYHRGGQWQYPAEARIERPIELNREYTLHVQVRGTLINAALDGEPMLAWRTPVERREGVMQLATFDALAVFHEVHITPLDPNVALREPGVPSLDGAKVAVAVAEKELHIAESAVAVAQAERASVERRSDAMQAAWAKIDAAADATDQSTLEQAEHDAAKAAVRAEREAAIAKSRHAIAGIELRLLSANADQKPAVEKELAAAREALETATKQLDEPGEQYAKLTGATWTATRFFNSSADDPNVVFPPSSTGRRTALANWITDRRNPLTARVAVNHIWMRHLGTPLVPTVFDFGRKGIRPANQELLDWLAAELMDNGWSMKHLHRVIVNSAAYRMSSSVVGGDANLAKDPDNRYLWRRTPIRLESQLVRDSVLSLAGTLDETMGGPTVPAAEQADSRRRSLYFFHSNNERNLFLTTFDEALVKDCYRREQSIVPQQALALTNSRLTLDAAPQIAQRLSGSATDDTEFIRTAFLVILGIQASDDEITASQAALADWRILAESSKDGQNFIDGRAYFIWVLLNHNDFVTLR